MARLEYADTNDARIAPLVERIRAQRGDVLHLYRMLLHSPPVAEGWLRFLTAIRRECVLPAALRELVIMRVALLNRAPYEADQHVAAALAAGISPQQLALLDQWRLHGAFDAEQQAVLAYTDAMTSEVQVAEEIFRAVRARFDDRMLVELTATIGAYNMVSRFLEALCIRSGDARANG